jgi:PAS domain S-box-containing protein
MRGNEVDIAGIRRIKALKALAIFDTPAEGPYDTLVACAADALGAPAAWLVFADQERAWPKAGFGPCPGETPLATSVTAQVLERPDGLAVAAIASEPSFEACTDLEGFGAVAGMPLADALGVALGALIVADHGPRHWSPAQMTRLAGLAEMASALLAGRRKANKVRRLTGEVGVLIERLETERSRQVAVEALALIGGWELDLATQTLTWSSQTKRIHEVEEDFEPQLEEAIDFYAPEARAMVQSAIEEAMLAGTGWDFEAPLITAKGNPIWVRAVGRVMTQDGFPTKLVGAFQDLTVVKLERDQRDLAARITTLKGQLQEAFLGDDPGAAFAQALDGLNAITGSGYGFIGEVLHDDGKPWLRTHAMSDISWNDETRRLFAERGPAGFEFRNLDTLFGAPLLSGEPLLTNAPAADPRAGGLPSGHPPLDSFLGAPILYGGEMVAMVGLANKPGGYERKDLTLIEPVLETIGQLVALGRERRRRLQSHADLRDALATTDRALRDVAAYQTALDKHAIVAITDAMGDIVFVNDKFCEISGFAREDLIGANHRILNSGVHPKMFFVDMWRAIGKGRSWQGEICNQSRTGELYWVDTTIVPMVGADGRPERFVSVRYDITHRKRADETLQAALGELTTFFDLSPDILCITDVNGTMLKVSRAALDVLGLSEQDMLGMRLHERVHPDDKEATRAAMLALEAERQLVTVVNRHPAPDGGWRSIEWRATRVGARVYISARDMTGQIAREAELRQARVDAEAAATAKSQFLANMSHEIRTPMNGVLGMLDLLADSGLAANQLDLARSGQSAAKALLSVLNDVLDMSKIEAGEIQVEALPVATALLVRDTLRLFEPVAQEKDLELVCEVAPGVPDWIETDPTRLRQIVSNLLSNAIKFTKTGSVRLAVDWREPGALTLRVTDTGIGMDEDARARLFQRFAQADASITRRFGGTGLGLSICKSLAERMGGSISVESTPGVGSCFTVIVQAPRTNTPSRPAHDTAATPGNATGGLSILVAEDYPMNQKLIGLILDKLGHRATIVDHGAQALDALDVGVFDLVLMDMQMPVMDGLTAARAIRARGDASAAVPILALTANADEDSALACRDAGMDAIVTKPIQVPDLVRAIATVLAPALQTVQPATAATI